METIYFVRHGGHKQDVLTPNGRVESMRAAAELKKRGIGEAALLLSSSHKRAVQTAEIIAEHLGISHLFSSDLMAVAGEDPDLIRNLDDVVAASLRMHNINSADGGLVIVAHMPLLGMIKAGDPYERVVNGEVVPYINGTWHNPSFVAASGLVREFEERFGL